VVAGAASCGPGAAEYQPVKRAHSAAGAGGHLLEPGACPGSLPYWGNSSPSADALTGAVAMDVCIRSRLNVGLAVVGVGATRDGLGGGSDYSRPLSRTALQLKVTAVAERGNTAPVVPQTHGFRSGLQAGTADGKTQNPLALREWSGFPTSLPVRGLNFDRRVLFGTQYLASRRPAASTTYAAARCAV